MKIPPRVPVALAAVVMLAAAVPAVASPLPQALPPVASDANCAATVEPAATEQNWQEEYGTCVLSCGEQLDPAYVDFATYEQCCNQLHLCPDGSYPVSKYWDPYVGWPLLCMT